MGVAEQGGEVAKTIVEGLKNSPSCLAAVILIGGLAYLVHSSRSAEEQRAQERFMLILNKCTFPNEQQLYEQPAPRGDFGGSR